MDACFSECWLGLSLLIINTFNVDKWQKSTRSHMHFDLNCPRLFLFGGLVIACTT